ncbi:hypothetical protein [Allomuricauda sp. F6463D]|uniref:hypothetical protein n=1 Tax=Allomuricauda sp. F6463D TaxID=2926409 RepID=UPI001FF2379B|nr:hypothetical protein [Muricauda sp. F6463D]MCK0160480.1 hypothetical protein [Muricauda sp. F6463D]
MIKKAFLTLSLASTVLFFLSCEKEDQLDLNEETAATPADASEVAVHLTEGGSLEFTDKASLAKLLEETDKTTFNAKIQELTDNGFQSLRPVFDDLESPEVQSFLSKKLGRLQKSGILYSLKGGQDDDAIDLDDEVISDPRFAALLDRDRGIIVGDSYYRYTTDGLYFCKREDKKKLETYLKELGNKKGFKPRGLTHRCAIKKAEIESSLSISPKQGTVVQVTDAILRYEIDGCGGGGGGYSGGGSTGGSSGGTTTATNYPILKPQGFRTCVYDEDSIWESIFGDREKCNEYHDSTHRVQTQFWNENYFLWASIGTKVKYQKKRLIGWSESSTAEYVQLGINAVKFTYNYVLKPNAPMVTKHVTYKYKGVVYDGETGNVLVGQQPPRPKDWPVWGEDEKLIDLEIYVDDIFGKTINKQIEFTVGNLNSSVYNLLAKITKTSLTSLKNEINQDKVAVKIVRFSDNKMEMIDMNRIKRGKSNETHRFDFNFLLTLGYGIDSGNVNFDFFKQFKAKKYDVAKVDIYGLALRNGTIKGSKVIAAD